MDQTPLEKMSRKEIDALLDVYRANVIDGVEVAAAADLANKPAAIAELTRLREVVGYPHTVTQEDMDLNPEDGLVLGETVYLSQAEVDEKTRVEGQAAADEKLVKAPDTSPEAPSGAQEAELVYLRKTVVRVSNRLIQGKSYVDVQVTTGETFTMSPEEYARDVHSRK